MQNVDKKKINRLIRLIHLETNRYVFDAKGGKTLKTSITYNKPLTDSLDSDVNGGTVAGTAISRNDWVYYK